MEACHAWVAQEHSGAGHQSGRFRDPVSSQMHATVPVAPCCPGGDSGMLAAWNDTVELWR
jgi:hypothetical protein